MAAVAALALQPATASATRLIGSGVLGKHMGVATCASAVCHGAVSPSYNYDVLLNEYTTWSHEDAHSRAYATLETERSRDMAARLNIGDPTRAKICLDCHADNVPPQMRGDKFSIADGVGCEACHGGAEHWLTTHTSPKATYRQDVARGMYPTADLRPRAELCLSCHYGTDEKFATHRIMAAGHPRLSFEMATFLALEPPHYRIDADYRRRKPTYGGTQLWAYSQLAATQHELQQLQGPRIENTAAFPELALFNCYGCHMSSMRRTDWGHRILDVDAPPGSVPVSDGYLCMAWIIARDIAPTLAPTLLKLSQSLIAASARGRDQIVNESRGLQPIIARLLNVAASRQWTTADERQLLRMMLAVGAGGQYRDYIDAEQAVMGIDGLLIELKLASRHRHSLDGLYKLVQNDEAYDPDKLVIAIRELQKELKGEA